jgi:hypothetical protein
LSLANGDSPRWFRLARQAMVFLLGVAILCYAVVSQGHDVAFLVTGLILIGLVPSEEVVTRLTARRDSPPAEHEPRPPLELGHRMTALIILAAVMLGLAIKVWVSTRSVDIDILAVIGLLGGVAIVLVALPAK